MARIAQSRLDALLSEGLLADERHAEAAPPIHGAPSRAADSPAAALELMRIHSALFPPDVRAVAAGVAVQTHGLGGIGKTELAARCVSDFAIAYPAGVLWLNLAAWQPPQPATEADAHAAWLRALDAALANAPALWRELALDAKASPDPPPRCAKTSPAISTMQSPHWWFSTTCRSWSPIDARRRILDFLAAPGPQARPWLPPATPARSTATLAAADRARPDDACACSPATGPRKPRPRARDDGGSVDEVGGHTEALVLLGERYQEDAGGYPRALQHLRKQGLPRHRGHRGQPARRTR